MNENENLESNEEIVSTVSGNDGLPLYSDNACGSEYTDVSAGDCGSSEQSVSDGNAGTEIVYGSNADTVSSGDYTASDMVTSIDYTEHLQTLSEEVNQLNVTGTLILLFLLLSWTEKRIFSAMNKFTFRRKER